MRHAIEIGFCWDALVLFDPPNVPRPGHPVYAAMEAFEARLPAFAGNRRTHYASTEELAVESPSRGSAKPGRPAFTT
jgi:hypothetical protein